MVESPRLTSRLVEVPPFSFWVRDEGSGTPVILLHGLGGSADWWKQNIEALAERHRVLAVDLIGFGRNRFFLKKSRLPLAFAEIATVLARWIETELGGEPVHLIGNSMGGHIAIHLASARPDLVRSLVLVNSTGVPFAVAPAEHLRSLFVPRGFWSFLVILARDVFRAGPTSLSVGLGRLLRDDARPLMRNLTMPVLLVWGEHDPLVPLRYGKEILRHIPNAKLEVIPRAGHIAMWEQPRIFNTIVARFLDEIEPAAAGDAARVFSWSISGWTGGIAHRQAGRRRDIILIHGLGMSSAYFGRFAEALFEEGWSPAAPDLPGFGESSDGPPLGPHQYAELLGMWADVLGIEDAVWVGHSLGNNAVAHLAAMRPDLVASSVYIGPLWRRRSPLLLLIHLFRDALLEPLTLYPHLLRAYWRSGILRWFRTFRLHFDDVHQDPPPGLMVVGGRDPLVDRPCIANYITVAGAHACHFSYPAATARVVTGPR